MVHLALFKIIKIMKQSIIKYIPNGISFLKILLSLILPFIKPLSPLFILIYIICGICDFLDGFLARKYNVTSQTGAKLDSIGDFILIFVMAVILLPIIKLSLLIVGLIIIVAIIRLCSIVIVIRKYRQVVLGLHTYANKVTGIVLFIYPISIYFNDKQSIELLICLIAFFSSIDELLINISSKKLRLDEKCFFIQ